MKQELFTGNSKIIYKTREEETLILSFTDKITDNNSGQTLEISGKGVINNSISAFLMQKLSILGVKNHLIKKLNMREQVVEVAEVLPIEVSVSAIACDRYVKEFKMEEGFVFDEPIIEFRVKNRELKYPVINEDQMINFGWLHSSEIKEVKQMALRIFDFLSGLFVSLDIRLVQCNLEFGRVFDSEDFEIILVDEITPDNCKLWDLGTNEKLGLEGALLQPDNMIESYQKIFNRLRLKQ